jgi:hypothetical protein
MPSRVFAPPRKSAQDSAPRFQTALRPAAAKVASRHPEVPDLEALPDEALRLQKKFMTAPILPPEGPPPAGPWSAPRSALSPLHGKAPAIRFGGAPPSGSPHPVQRMILSLGDLESMEKMADEEGKKLTEEERKEAKIITDAVTTRSAQTGETVRSMIPDAEKKGLSTIGRDEELRIIAHGNLDEKTGVATSFGGFSATDLVQILQRMRLPEGYRGVVFLAGCHTAQGPDDGYLGVFYKALSAIYPAVKVRGTLGAAFIGADGKDSVIHTAGYQEKLAEVQTEVERVETSRKTLQGISGVVTKNPGVLAAYLGDEGPSVDDLAAVLVEAIQENTGERDQLAAIVQALPDQYVAGEDDERATVQLPR